MKKSMAVMALLALFLVVGCDYDDSNDIDILIPNDTTATGIYTSKVQRPLD